MEQDVIREKSLQLIRVTKEFLLLKKEEENSMGVVSYLMNARIIESAGGSFEMICSRMPQNILQLVKESGSLREAEKKALSRAKELQIRMARLAPEIRNLSDLIEPYIAMSPPQQAPERQQHEQAKVEPAKIVAEQKQSASTTTSQK